MQMQFKTVEECRNETFQVAGQCDEDALYTTEKCKNGATQAIQTNHIQTLLFHRLHSFSAF